MTSPESRPTPQTQVFVPKPFHAVGVITLNLHTANPRSHAHPITAMFVPNMEYGITDATAGITLALTGERVIRNDVVVDYESAAVPIPPRSLCPAGQRRIPLSGANLGGRGASMSDGTTTLGLRTGM